MAFEKRECGQGRLPASILRPGPLGPVAPRPPQSPWAYLGLVGEASLCEIRGEGSNNIGRNWGLQENLTQDSAFQNISTTQKQLQNSSLHHFHLSHKRLDHELLYL